MQSPNSAMATGAPTPPSVREATLPAIPKAAAIMSFVAEPKTKSVIEPNYYKTSESE